MCVSPARPAEVVVLLSYLVLHAGEASGGRRLVLQASILMHMCGCQCLCASAAIGGGEVASAARSISSCCAAHPLANVSPTP